MVFLKSISDNGIDIQDDFDNAQGLGPSARAVTERENFSGIDDPAQKSYKLYTDCSNKQSKLISLSVKNWNHMLSELISPATHSNLSQIPLGL